MELVCCTTALKRHTGARRTERMRATLKCASEDAEKEGEACARKMKVDPMVGANLRKQPALVTTPGLLLLGPHLIREVKQLRARMQTKVRATSLRWRKKLPYAITFLKPSHVSSWLTLLWFFQLVCISVKHCKTISINMLTCDIIISDWKTAHLIDPW